MKLESAFPCSCSRQLEGRGRAAVTDAYSLKPKLGRCAIKHSWMWWSQELIALGEAVGMESKGLAVDTIASLPSFFYRAQDKQDANMEQYRDTILFRLIPKDATYLFVEWYPNNSNSFRCVICRVEFNEGKSLVALPCEHPYHSECINQWLQLNKVYAPPYIFWNHVFYDVTLNATLGTLSTCILLLCQVCPMCSAEVPTSVNKQAWLLNLKKIAVAWYLSAIDGRSANC